MASSPSYDPNALRSPRAYERLCARRRRQPLVNRATQFGYAPGSTFKVVTATAAIDTGAFTPESTVSGRNGMPISGVPLQNDNNDSFGQITLTQALAESVNTVWAQVAERLGKPTMARYMSRFGFDRKPQLDYPSERDVGERRVSPRAAAPPHSPARRRRAHGHRPGQTCRSRPCRWPRSPPPSPTAGG